jgi:hypothetical protein
MPIPKLVAVDRELDFEEFIEPLEEFLVGKLSKSDSYLYFLDRVVTLSLLLSTEDGILLVPLIKRPAPN